VKKTTAYAAYDGKEIFKDYWNHFMRKKKFEWYDIIVMSRRVNKISYEKNKKLIIKFY